jgi:predicted lactoylglutathione lyase
MVPARVSLVTLGVSDFKRSLTFYRSLGWRPAIEMDDFAVLDTAGPYVALYPQHELSRDLGEPVPGAVVRRSTLAINVGSREEVDEYVAEFIAAGASLLSAPVAAEWGGYTSLVADPDGHAWEIAHNPGWPLGEDGLPRIPTDG